MGQCLLKTKLVHETQEPTRDGKEVLDANKRLMAEYFTKKVKTDL